MSARIGPSGPGPGISAKPPRSPPLQPSPLGPHILADIAKSVRNLVGSAAAVDLRLVFHVFDEGSEVGEILQIGVQLFDALAGDGEHLQPGQQLAGGRGFLPGLFADSKKTLNGQRR